MGEERVDFSENFRASLFNDDVSFEPNFSQIHLVGQYLCIKQHLFHTFIHGYFPAFCKS